MCEGKTWDEVIEGYQDRIERNGFTKLLIEPDLDDPVWMYTIGLTEQGHPELCLEGIPREICGVILEELGRRVVQGERFDLPRFFGGEALLVHGLYVHAKPADGERWEDGKFNHLIGYYVEWLEEEPTPPLAAVEITVCGSETVGYWDSPGPRMNRTQRRARMRGRLRSVT
ncbi:MAG TPA: DUF4262 domain-containing protein [Acidimicrobiales bacterium]